MNNQMVYWYKKYTPRFIQKFLKKIEPEKISYWKLDRISKKNIDFSGHGETQAVKQYLKNDSLDFNYFVDIGASDGVSSSSTLEFAKMPNWHGLSIEYDDNKFSKLQYVYRKYKNISLANKKVTPDSIVDILLDYEVPKNFSFLNIDIDSYDLEVSKSLFQLGYRPDIVSIEINEKIPPPIYFNVKYDQEHFWQGDHFFGCSLTAAVEEFSQFDYLLAEFRLNNAIFVNLIKFPELTPKNASIAYDEGYKSIKNRKELFKYNHDVEILHELNNDEKIVFINNLFKKYKNMYELKIGDQNE
tara:strand:- start:106 stop:1005 length:900 start_codon:yes stop_codon:yes gene_type:complete